MRGHDPHALGALLHHGRVFGVAALGVLREPIDERAERRCAGALEAARDATQTGREVRVFLREQSEAARIF